MAEHKDTCLLRRYLRLVNWLDFLLAGILLIGLVRGFMNGFVYEIAHLGAYFLGLYAGFALANTVAEQLTRITGAAPAL
ncbi:MAG: CvpA family protein, partial [Flavobacteriales bacterium]